MNYILIFHTDVETDLSETYNWYENKQDGLGERFLTELSVCYNQLENHPEYYGKAVQAYRRIKMTHFPYIIAFEIVKETVFVYAVFHSSRSQKEILKRKKSV